MRTTELTAESKTVQRAVLVAVGFDQAGRIQARAGAAKTLLPNIGAWQLWVSLTALAITPTLNDMDRFIKSTSGPLLNVINTVRRTAAGEATSCSQEVAKSSAQFAIRWSHSSCLKVSLLGEMKGVTDVSAGEFYCRNEPANPPIRRRVIGSPPPISLSPPLGGNGSLNSNGFVVPVDSRTRLLSPPSSPHDSTAPRSSWRESCVIL